MEPVTESQPKGYTSAANYQSNLEDEAEIKELNDMSKGVIVGFFSGISGLTMEANNGNADG